MMQKVITFYVGSGVQPNLFTSASLEDRSMRDLESELEADGCTIYSFRDAVGLLDTLMPEVGQTLPLFVPFEKLILPSLVLLGVTNSTVRRSRPRLRYSDEYYSFEDDVDDKAPEMSYEELFDGAEFHAVRLVRWVQYRRPSAKIVLFSPSFDSALSNVCDHLGVLYTGGLSLSTIAATCKGALGARVEERTVILRSIEFPPEFSQAGISLLSYFGTIVQQKYPGEPIRIGIQQEGLRVTMFVETPQGEMREKLEEALDEYGLVLQGQRQVEDFIEDPFHVIELRNQLRLAATQVEQKKELLLLARSQTDRDQQRIQTLENRVDDLYGMVGRSLERTHEQADSLQKSLTLLASATSGHVELALSVIQDAVARGLMTSDEETVKAALKTIRQKDPGLFQRLFEIGVKDPLAGAIGNLFYKWLLAVQMLPH